MTHLSQAQAGEQPRGSSVIVSSRIIKSDGTPVSIVYVMREASGEWRVADIYLDGTISELATRRSEYAAILQQRGLSGLTESLNRKADLLSGGAGR